MHRPPLHSREVPVPLDSLPLAACKADRQSTLLPQLGDDPSKEDVKAFTEKTLASGKVVPGFGHAVLRKTVRQLASTPGAVKRVGPPPQECGKHPCLLSTTWLKTHHGQFELMQADLF